MKKQIFFRPVYFLWFMLTFLFFNSACDKEEHLVDAVVLDLGSPAVDGCGFVLEIEGDIYYPVNLEEKYQVDEKAVKVRYSLLEGMHTCGFPDSEIKYQKVNITEIRGS